MALRFLFAPTPARVSNTRLAVLADGSGAPATRGEELAISAELLATREQLEPHAAIVTLAREVAQADVRGLADAVGALRLGLEMFDDELERLAGSESD